MRIVMETEYDACVSVNGTSAWVPKTWIVDGELNDQGVQLLNKIKAKAESEAKAARDWKEGFHAVQIGRETDRAIAIVAEIRLFDQLGGGVVEQLVWVPKSVCRNRRVPGWMLDKKTAEIKNQTRNTGWFKGFKFQEVK